jgi:hypothetical protein
VWLQIGGDYDRSGRLGEAAGKLGKERLLVGIDLIPWPAHKGVEISQ